MDARGPIPFNAAQAYGLRPSQNARASAPRGRVENGFVVPPSLPNTGARAERVAERVTLGSVGPAAAPRGSSPVQQLVSGRVESPVGRGEGFDQPAAREAAPAGAPMQMYTRSADRVEVATSVATGRSLDVRG
ncbi:MAG: hypothetical protein ACO3QC_11670 [Phycisphaerales bacterium]